MAAKVWNYAAQIERYGRETVLARKRAHYRKHAEKHKAATKKYREENREKWLEYNREYQRQRFAKDPNYWRKKAMKGIYGITFDEYEAMVKAQGNKCAICDGEFSQTDVRLKPHIDHCHGSDLVRGVLCNLCNVMLGSARDNESILRRAAMYLEAAAKRIKEA